jgi:hypothetical protein
MLVGLGFFTPHLKVDIALGVACRQHYMGLSEWMAVAAAQHANGDGFVVIRRKNFVRPADLSREKNQSDSERLHQN